MKDGIYMTKKPFPSKGRIASIVAIVVGVLVLLIDHFGEYEWKYGWICQYIAIIFSVGGILHTYFSYVLDVRLEKTEKALSERINDCAAEIKTHCEMVHFEQLTHVEMRHGIYSKKRKNQIWIVTNTLQEVEDGAAGIAILESIFQNITKYNVQYYYIMPDNGDAKKEIETLGRKIYDKMSTKQKNNCQEISDRIKVYHDKNLDFQMPTSKYDIVIYVDCDDAGRRETPITFASTTIPVEGYFNLSEHGNNEDNYYRKMSITRATYIIEQWCQYIESPRDDIEFKPIKFEEENISVVR
jgi:hypothetical protein